jgi:endonuclease III
MTKKQKAREVLAILKGIYPNPKCELNFHPEKPYELLLAVIMSAQTTDKQVNVLTNTLFSKYQTLHDFAYAELDTLTKDMSSIGLFRAKAKNIQATCLKLIQEFEGNIPATTEEIQTLPGAGRKTANVVLFELYGINSGIAVDTHAARLSTLLGLTKETNPLNIEKDLMKLLPQEEWGNFSHRLILYGRYYWQAHKPLHDGPLSIFADDKVVKKMTKKPKKTASVQ